MLNSITAQNQEILRKVKRDTIESLNALYEGTEMVLNAFKSGIFWLPNIEGTGHPWDLSWCLKILTHKQMLQRMPIALEQVKAGNTSENLLNKILEIIYSLYQSKEITKKVCNNIMNSKVIGNIK